MLNWKSLAALGAFLVQPSGPTQASLMTGQLRARETPAKRPNKTYPHGSSGEAARRARQIAKGQLTRANGLVWPGQLISRTDGKLYLRRLPAARGGRACA